MKLISVLSPIVISAIIGYCSREVRATAIETKLKLEEINFAIIRILDRIDNLEHQFSHGDDYQEGN